jgi:hypothetical protein
VPHSACPPRHIAFLPQKTAISDPRRRWHIRCQVIDGPKGPLCMEAHGLSTTWINIIQQRRDANIGATIIRLAQQATQLHLDEVRRADATVNRAGGTSPQAVVPQLASHPQGGVQ